MKTKTRGLNRTTECTSSLKTPPPRFHALARLPLRVWFSACSLRSCAGWAVWIASCEYKHSMSAAGNPRPGSAAGPVQQGLKEALIETLTAILSPVQEVRAAAEEQIKVLEVTEGEW